MRHHTLEHRFVKHVPDVIEPGVLYVSVEFGSVVHACCCGCGAEVVTPLTPTDWKLIFDGETVSLRPSVGSWTLPCRSHYFIDRNRVVVAGPWTDEQVEASRKHDQLAKSRYYNTLPPPSDPARISKSNEQEPNKQGLLSWLWSQLRGD